eukprot:UN03359
MTESKAESMTVRINNVVAIDDVLAEQKVSDSETNDGKIKIKTIRNPFGQFKRNNTKQILSHMNILNSNKKELVKLETWLEKKQQFSWHKKWVVVKDHLLWSDKKLSIKNSKNKQERDKFNNCVNLMSITRVDIISKSKSKRKFVVNVQLYGKDAKTKQYIWKAASTEDRDYWVKGLKQHIQYIKSMVLYLGTKEFDQ